MRLQKTAEMAREKEFDAFTTTLLISPYQNQELITEIGKEMAREFGVDFHYEDFRDGFRESQHLALEFGLYRQKYCGCVYSEWERYGKVKIAGDKVLKLTSRGKVKEEIFLSEKEA
jgi:hypothetical protein